jgi:hypothetical protein
MSATVTLEPWGSGDLPLLERLMGDPRMTEHLGGPRARTSSASVNAVKGANIGVASASSNTSSTTIVLGSYCVRHNLWGKETRAGLGTVAACAGARRRKDRGGSAGREVRNWARAALRRLLWTAAPSASWP